MPADPFDQGLQRNLENGGDLHGGVEARGMCPALNLADGRAVEFGAETELFLAYALVERMLATWAPKARAKASLRPKVSIFARLKVDGGRVAQ
jgi:hypothetical protein